MNNVVTTNTNTNVVVVTAPGPAGVRGSIGPQGPTGTVSGNTGINSTGSSILSGSVNIIGTLSVTGSTSFLGTALLNGAPILTAATLATDRIATTGVTASVSTGNTVFTVSSASIDLFKVTNTGTSGSFIGAFSGSGANLFNIPASGIVGLNLSQIASTTATASISAASGFQVNTNTGITGSLIVTAGVSGSFSGSFQGITTGQSFTTGSFTGIGSGSFSGSFQGNGSGLTNVPASGIVGLNLSQVATGSVSASVNVGSTTFQIVSGSSTLLAVDNTGLATISSSINIGRPSDGSYTTGFFDTFTTATKVSDAIDEISAAFLDLAPAKAGTLTSQTLTLSSPSTFTGYLAGGLNSTDWYVGASAFQAISSLVSSTSAVYATPSTSTIFRAGKYSNLSPSNVLEGGVSASIASGSQTLAVYSTRALSAGTGLSGAINITSLAQYNTFWVKANAQIQHTLTTTGSYKYAVTADNAAGTTNTSQLWYVGGAGDFPAQSVTADTPITSSTTFNYLSGIPYLKTATFTLGITGSNLFNPVYNLNQVSFTSTYFSSLTTGSNSPNYNDTLRLNVTRTLATNVTSRTNNVTGLVTVSKPNKSDQSVSYTLTNQGVNSYTTAQSTNTTEYFLDEARRYSDFQTSTWNSGSALVDGNLQVQNGRLINGNSGNYPSFVAATQEYFRALTVTSFTAGGTHTFTVTGFSSVSQWGSGGELEIAFVKTADVTGPQTASTIWDFGRAFGNNSGNIKGIVVTGTGLSGTFSLGTDNSGNGSLILYVKYNNVSTLKVISQFTVSM
jgi:hypothetical protein